MVTSYSTTYREFGWPEIGEIFDPNGVGAQVFAELARHKICCVLERMTNDQVNIGIL